METGYVILGLFLFKKSKILNFKKILAAGRNMIFRKEYNFLKGLNFKPIY